MTRHILYRQAEEILQRQPRMTLEELAQAYNRRTHIGITVARREVGDYRSRLVRRINKNGMSVWNEDVDGRVAGILRGHTPGSCKPTVALVRVDDQDDPRFLEQVRHFVESGTGARNRGGVDIRAAGRRGQLTAEGAVTPLLVALPPLQLK